MNPLFKTLLPLAAKPLQIIPSPVHELAMAKLLNRWFAEELAQHELAFLHQRQLLIQVRDLNFQLKITVRNHQFVAATAQPANVTLSGDSIDFLALIGQQTDPDTLFFQRRLDLAGDTELGLQVKNFLDAIAWEARLPKSLQYWMGRLFEADKNS